MRPLPIPEVEHQDHVMCDNRCAYCDTPFRLPDNAVNKIGEVHQCSRCKHKIKIEKYLEQMGTRTITIVGWNTNKKAGAK